MKLQKTLVTDKPRSAVFDYLSDFTTTTEWWGARAPLVVGQGACGRRVNAPAAQGSSRHV